MKVDPIKLIISLALSAIIAYGLYHFNRGDFSLVLTIGSFIFLGILSGTISGVGLTNRRASTNVKVLAGVFYPLALVVNIIFMFVNFTVPIYVIVNGLFLLIFISLAYSIGKAKQ